MIFGSIIGGLIGPIVNGIVTVLVKSKDVTIETFRASGAIASAQADYMKAVLGHPLSPASLMCYAIAFWFVKVIVADNMIGPAFGFEWSTPDLKGGTKEIAMIVVSGMFFSAIAHVWRR
jgi:hypothetical protein